MTLTEFLLARIAEDEAWAEEAINLAAIYDSPKWHWIVAHDDGGRWQPTNATPQRVLAECEAKRRIVEWATERWAHFEQTDVAGGWPDTQAMRDVERVLSALALPYADHPDFREEWVL